MWPWRMPALTACRVSVGPTTELIGITSISTWPSVMVPIFLAHSCLILKLGSPEVSEAWNFHSYSAAQAVDAPSSSNELVAMTIGLRLIMIEAPYDCCCVASGQWCPRHQWLSRGTA